MKTAQDVISDIQQLSPEEKQIVVDFVNSTEEEEFQVTKYSEEDLAELDRRYEEAKRGINVSPELEGEEAINYLRRLRKA